MQHKKGVYIAVLNQGGIRPELAHVLHQMPSQDKYEVIITYPMDKPITQNRNKIVQDFLPRKEFDYLMMIDGDIVPPINILNLADFQVDIVAPMLFAYQKMMIVPLALREDKDGLYKIAAFRGDEGLMEVDAVGSGCIMMSREVLEKVKFPFKNEYDADGIKKIGLDLHFCKEAKKLGFKVYTHLDYICSHWMEFDLKTIYNWMLDAEEMQRELQDLKSKISRIRFK